MEDDDTPKRTTYFLVRVYNERMKNKINQTRIPKEWLKFQKNLMPSPTCEGCNINECIVLYDSRHDEYFSRNCGTVIFGQAQYKIPYSINCTSSINNHKTKSKRKGR